MFFDNTIMKIINSMAKDMIGVIDLELDENGVYILKEDENNVQQDGKASSEDSQGEDQQADDPNSVNAPEEAEGSNN